MDETEPVERPVEGPVEQIRRYFDECADEEWHRLTENVRGRVSLEVHRRFLRELLGAGRRVLEIGAGPGRFTLELAALGTRVVVTDLSPVQLALNERYAAAAQGCVERRELLDIRDTSRYADGEFDAVVAFGGPLSYVFEDAEPALRGLLRIIRPGGVVLASVMSLLGTWRAFLPAVVARTEEAGEDANDRVLRTGDLRAMSGGSGAHVCRMYRWSEVRALVGRAGGEVVDGSASGWAALGDEEALARIEADPGRWARFLGHEIEACRQPGAIDGGTHILFAARPAGPRRLADC